MHMQLELQTDGSGDDDVDVEKDFNAVVDADVEERKLFVKIGN